MINKNKIKERLATVGNNLVTASVVSAFFSEVPVIVWLTVFVYSVIDNKEAV